MNSSRLSVKFTELKWSNLSLLLIIFFTWQLPLGAAEEFPNHDIVLFDLIDQAGQLSLANPQVIADSPGYDNQPYFTADGQQIYFTHIEDGNADMWQWSLAEKQAKVIIESPLSEYSPTSIPSRPDSISTVVVEADGTQRLWRYHSKTGFSLIFDAIKPVGYHVWVGDLVGLFVLGEPHLLQIAQLSKQSSRTIDQNIGRCLQKIPEQQAFSYTVQSDQGWLVKRYDIETDKTSNLLTLPESSEDYVWLNNQKIISSNGRQLMVAQLGSELNWQSIKNTTKFNLSEISRLAISPDRTKLAVVYVKPHQTDLTHKL